MAVPHLNDVTTTISCVPKMAESVREVERNRNKNIRLMSENGEFLSANSEKQIVNDSLNNLKSLFYLNNVENNCFSKYSVDNDGVNRASEFCPDVHGFSSEYKGICPNNDENCRKKRCSDRYDSSESSDSGIAVSSSASSGTSDITDPGSPFSTSSDDSSSSPGKCKVEKRCKSEEKSPSWLQPTGRCRSEEKAWTEPEWEEKQQSDKTDHNFITPETEYKMAPNVPSASSPCDIWTSITENNTANDTAHFKRFNKTQSEAISNKRLKADAKDSIALLSLNNIVVNVPSPIISEIEPDIADNKKKSSGDNCEGAKVKMRKSSYDSAKIINKEGMDGGRNNKSGPKNCDKFVGTAAKAKQDRNRHQGKITEYFKSQIKSLVGMKRDFGSKKDALTANKAKPANETVAKKADEPPAKKAKMGAEEKPMDVPVFVKPSPKLQPLQTFMPSAEPIRLVSFSNLPKGADFLLKKPAETKTLFNKILQNHKNRKLAESYMKCRTVLKPKPAPAPAPTPAPEVDVSKSSHKPFETSTRNNVTEMPNTKVEELGSNLEENKVQNKDLDSNLLSVVSHVTEVTNREVISKRSDAPESDSSKSPPILSTPTTIRFPATGHNNRPDKHRNRESISCRWDSCTAQSDSASGLLEHLQTAHVLSQVSGEKFVCLWVGCKVFDQKSCSRSWLERHVLSHAGNKPYRCIVDGCGQGFSTQAILERHVNSHFAADVKKALDNSIVHKLFRRNGKKLRYRRQPWSESTREDRYDGIRYPFAQQPFPAAFIFISGKAVNDSDKDKRRGTRPRRRTNIDEARMFDFFDSGIMEGLEHRLVQLTKARTGGDIADISGKSLALTSQVIARRMTANGRQQFLLRWFPENIVEDEWVYEKEITRKKTVSIPSLSPSVSSSLLKTLELATRSSPSYRTGRRKNKGMPQMKEPVRVEEEVEKEPCEALPAETVCDRTSEPPGKPETPTVNVPAKKVKTKTKKKKNEEVKAPADPNPLPAVRIPVVDIAKDGSLATEKTVSLRPREESSVAAAIPEEMSVVPVCSPAEEVVPVQTGGIIVDSTKLIAPMKTEMIVSSPLKLVASQFIEQPFVQTVMPVQMPVTYQIPIVKLSQTSGMFFPQIPNYIIPPQPPMFPAPSVPAFRNGFHFSTTGTIQIQASTTTLQHTASSFVQSTNTSGFQIVQSPANMQQSILTAFQNSGVTNLNLKSPTLRLLNCQPLILNNAKPMTNLSMTLTNVSSIANPNTSALTVPTVAAMPLEPNNGKKVTTTPAPATPPQTPTTTPKKLVKQKPNILPKPNISQKNGGGVTDGTKNKKQCLQSCGPAAGAAT